MQDIRPELRERLKQIQEQREAKRQELAELDAIDQGLQKVLESETALWKRLAPTPPLFQQANEDHGSNGNGRTLPDLLQEFMKNGEPWTIERFKVELQKRGYPFGEKAPGRVVNFALVGMQNHGVARKRTDNSWELTH